MQYSAFKPSNDVQDFLDNPFNFHIYRVLTRSEYGEGLFEPLEFFNLLYSRFQIVENQLSKPLDIIRGLAELKLPGKKYFFLLDRLLALIFESGMSDFEKVSAPSRSKVPYEPLFVIHYLSVRKQLDKPEFLQKNQLQLLLIFELIYEERASIAHLASIEIPSLKSFLDGIEVEEETELPKLKIKSGEKANIIRVFDALHELKLIETVDGSCPSKKEYMTLLGNFFGEDLSNFGPALNLALKAEEETHLGIFYRLQKIAKSMGLPKCWTVFGLH